MTFDGPQELPISFLETRSLSDFSLGWAVWPRGLGSLVPAFRVLELHPAFNMCWELCVGSHEFAASVLPTKPSARL